MNYKDLPKRDYCYWCQKKTKFFYGRTEETDEYRGYTVTYLRTRAFCTRCHNQARYEIGEVWDCNLNELKTTYKKLKDQEK